MNRKRRINQLMSSFDEEKRFITDGYYRIRTLSEHEIELAYLKAGSCGDTIAHPQITVSLSETQAIGEKLIDMDACPPLFLSRDSNNAKKIDNALDDLIEKFLQATKKYQG